MTETSASPAASKTQDWRHLWTLDDSVTFLNHGSFGACPRVVLDHQTELRARLEREPVSFMVRELETLLDASRERLAEFVGADPGTLAFVPNATSGVNTVLRSLSFQPGDELMVSRHEYNACRNALDYAAACAGARVVVVPVPFPVRDADEIVQSFLQAMTPRTRLLLVDHMTSQTACIMPLERIIPEAKARGIDVLVDGAHAPGMLPLDLSALQPTFYTGNCHKWICAPKGVGFLHVPLTEQKRLRPLVISHGMNSARTDRSFFHLEFDWVGTNDPTAAICVGRAIEYLGSLLPGGWPALRAANHEKVVEARRRMLARWERAGHPVEAPVPEAMLGSMAALTLRDGGPGERDPRLQPMPDGGDPPGSALDLDPLQERLWRDHQIEVPIIAWPNPPKRLVRISAQLYNRLEEYDRLADALVADGAAL